MNLIRKIVLKTLKTFNRDITINHHHTKNKLYLNLYKHKGYWYYAKNRELDTINSFNKLIQPGNYVIEVGGHIGYMSLILADLIKDNGYLTVFEPGINNLPYIKKNTSSNPLIEIIEKGAGNENMTTSFFIEDLTGQNNSFLKDYSVFDENNKNALNNATKRKVEVEMVKLDDFVFIEKNKVPNFIKIDVEGFEYQVLQGSKKIIENCSTIFMVEVTMHHKNIYTLFNENNYNILNDKLEIIDNPEKFEADKYSNRFFIPKTK